MKVDYELVTGSREQLKYKVQEKIKEGFVPFGGASISVNWVGGAAMFAQAMVKYTFKAPFQPKTYPPRQKATANPLAKPSGVRVTPGQPGEK